MARPRKTPPPVTEAVEQNDVAQKVAQKNTALEKAKGERMKGRGGRYNFPNAVPPENPEDVRRALSEVLNWGARNKLSPPKTNEEAEMRVDEFFGRCAERGERPTVEKLALVLGVSRKTLWSWRTEQSGSAERRALIQYAFDVLAAFDAEMAIENKMQPVPYIFRAKNYYDMKDTADIVVTPNNPLGETQDPDIIAAKYQELPDD